MASSIKERDLQLKFRTQEQLSKSERLAMIGRLAAGIAHEINNPLGGIMLFSSLLLKKAPPESIERENLERISNEAKRCQKIVHGLLDFSRQRSPKIESNDIREVIEKTLGLIENQAMFQNIEVVKDYAADCPAVQADASQMQQVFINIIINAVEAMKGQGKLTISTRTADQAKAVQISITDTGCGISPENLDRLFEPFFTTREVGKGTGLGLSISRGIVENHGGTIWASSRIGEGSTFFIRIPSGQNT
jgi:two-component system NtrC family sensor kinase